jgi:hypothetical protein
LERQKHGLDYETKIITENKLIKNTNYTGKWDSYEGDKPVSVKCVGVNGSIDFGDFKRQTEVKEDFLLYIGFWQYNKNKEKVVIEEYKLLIKYEDWMSYLGNIDIIDDMLKEMKYISNDKIDDDKWKKFRSKYTKLYNYNKKSIIKLRFKRDHKKQKRIQCGISNKNFRNIILKDNIINL